MRLAFARAFAGEAWLLPVLQDLVDAPTLQAALTGAVEAGEGSVWRVAVERAGVDLDVLLHAAARRAHVRVADLACTSRQALELLPERWARRFQVVPLAATDSVIEIATSSPHDLDCERAVAFASGRRVVMALAAPDRIARRLDELYSGEAPVRPPDAMLEVQHLGRDADQAPPSAGDDGAATAALLVDELLGAGIAGGASDIHIEPDEQGIAVRHRVDGVLRVVRRLPRGAAASLVSRVKILSGLDIADRLRPQDGRARVAVNGGAVDLRVSTLPAAHGEKVVIRVLDGRSNALTLDSMGLFPDELARVERLLQAREGLILVTGPTGSGKTTTLYAALRALQQRGVNIVTVEDPVEYRLPGVVQVQVHERAGLTFAAALRSIMRQDPDVLLVGEIRDRETAEIAIQASLTGHLVLSTLHTNDAASAVTRLADIGVAPYKIATAVKGVVAQRLVRRACARCGGPVAQPSGADAAAAPASCPECRGTGYRGRLAIVEVLIASPEFERAVCDGGSAERIADVARLGGMRSLWESGGEHVRRGETTLEEVLRVAAPPALAAMGGASGQAAEEPPAADRPGTMTVREPVAHAAAAPEPTAAIVTGPARVDVRRPTRYFTARHLPVTRPSHATERPVVQISVGTIDVFVIRPLPEGWRVLALQRALDTRCPTAWETVHGRIERDEEPEDAAVREVREETGLDVARLYAVAVQPFFMRPVRTVQLSVVFAAFVQEPADVALGPEHQEHAWLTVDEATARFVWPTERNSMQQIVQLLANGDAGAVEDVLRVF